MNEHSVSVLNCNTGYVWTEVTNQTHIIRQPKPAPNNGSTKLSATRLRLSAGCKSVAIHDPSPADQPHLSQFASHPASLTSKCQQPLSGPSSRNASDRAGLSRSCLSGMWVINLARDDRLKRSDSVSQSFPFSTGCESCVFCTQQ
jgi:hypothetical protein